MKLVMDYHLKERDRPHLYPIDEALALVEATLDTNQYLDGLENFRYGQFNARNEDLLAEIAQGRWHVLKQSAGTFNWGRYHDPNLEFQRVSAPITLQHLDAPTGPVPLNGPPRECVFAKCRILPQGEFHFPGEGPGISVNAFGNWGILRTQGWVNPGASVLHYVPGVQASPAAMVSQGAMARMLRSTLMLEMTGAGSHGPRTLRPPTAAGITPAGAAISMAVGTVALLWANYNEDDPAYYPPDQLADRDMLNTQVRLVLSEQDDGAVRVEGLHTGRQPQWRQVKRLRPTQYEEKLTFDLGDGVTLIWTPIVDTNGIFGIPALEGVPLSPPAYVQPSADQDDYYPLINPIHSPDYRDAILVFPASVGIQPVYIAWSVRYEPGVVTGVGEDVSGIWLAGAGEGIGVPIPTRIADKLRGRSFASFDGFRGAFWREIAKDETLAQPFILKNINRMRKGKSPLATSSGQAGIKQSFELHHVEPIYKGGSVYDVDNLRANTPKNHINIHKQG